MGVVVVAVLLMKHMALHTPSSFPSQALLSCEGPQHHSKHLLQGKACPESLVSSWRAAGAWGRIRLGSFPLSSNITLTSFSKMSISSHYQQPQSRGWCSFSMCSDSSLSSPCRDLYLPVWWDTCPGWCWPGTSTQGAVEHPSSPWLTSPAHLLLSDAPRRGCTHREVPGFPQPPLGHAAQPQEEHGWSHHVLLQPSVLLSVLSPSSSVVFGGLTACFH